MTTMSLHTMSVILYQREFSPMRTGYRNGCAGSPPTLWKSFSAIAMQLPVKYAILGKLRGSDSCRMTTSSVLNFQER
jgi:hypothetical protein